MGRNILRQIPLVTHSDAHIVSVSEAVVHSKSVDLCLGSEEERGRSANGVQLDATGLKFGFL